MSFRWEAADDGKCKQRLALGVSSPLRAKGRGVWGEGGQIWNGMDGGFNRQGVPGPSFFALFRVLLLFFSPTFFTTIFNGFFIDFGRVWRVFWEVILAT